jgi:hypothetical protein
MRTPTTAASRGRPVTAMSQRVKKRDAVTSSARRGRSRPPAAPSRIGSTVTAPTATQATTIAEPMPMRPTKGRPVAKRPEIATTTMAPAASTEVPAVAPDRRTASGTESPAARCSRWRPTMRSA